MPLYYTSQYFSTTLNVGGGIDDTQTTGITVQSVSGLDITKPGIACISYSDPLDTATAEWVTYTSINASNVLQGVTRGAEGYTAKSHSNGATIVFPLSKSHINNLADMFTTGGDGWTQIATPTNPASGYNKLYFKSDGLLYRLTSAGVEAQVGGDVTASSTTTFTNKRITKRVQSVTSAATVTPSADDDDCVIITAQAEALTIANPTGTPTNLQPLEIRILDNGTARAITFGSNYFASTDIPLPTTTLLSKTMYLIFQYNSARGKWDLGYRNDTF